MTSNDRPQWFEDLLLLAFPDSEEQRSAWRDGTVDVTASNTAKIATDLDGNPDPCAIRRGLIRLYRLFQILQDDIECWEKINYEFQDFSNHLPLEPAIIAAALAIQPEERPEWELVQAWSWVYRHALMLDVDHDDFEEWCERQNPETSRTAVLTELMRAGHIEAFSSAAEPTIFDAANGNA